MSAILIAIFLTVGAQNEVEIAFVPESEQFAVEAAGYAAYWEEEGPEIIAAFESVSGLDFAESGIEAVVYDGISQAGSDSEPMRLRAGLGLTPRDSDLVHELGHRHLQQISRLGPPPRDIDSHRFLFLILYDVWVDLYGHEFADSRVEIESARRGRFDYESAWDWALFHVARGTCSAIPRSRCGDQGLTLAANRTRSAGLWSRTGSRAKVGR